MCCTLWAGFLIHPLRQLCDKGTMSPKMSQDESQSQMPKIMVTEPGSPLQVSVRMGSGSIPHPPWGHRAASLSEDGLSGLEKWSHTPAVVPQYSLTYPIGRGRGQRRWNPTPSASWPRCPGHMHWLIPEERGGARAEAQVLPLRKVIWREGKWYVQKYFKELYFIFHVL